MTATPAVTGTCPACNAPISPGTKFCAQCGASLTLPPPPPPPPTGSGAGAPPAPGAPTDIRERIGESRGWIAKLELLVPGFHGYRQGEDARMADELLRSQVADKIHASLGDLQVCRQNLALSNQFANLNELALILSDLQVLEGRIRHAAQGYSGVAAAVRVGASQLDRLYEYDYGFAIAADQLRTGLGPLEDAANANDGARIAAEVTRVRGLSQQLRSAFEARMTTVEGIRST